MWNLGADLILTSLPPLPPSDSYQATFKLILGIKTLFKVRPHTDFFFGYQKFQRRRNSVLVLLKKQSHFEEEIE